MTIHYAIIVAGGTGSRMGSDVPKQFMLLNGLPVMMHTLLAFQRSKCAPHLVLVLHPSMQEQWRLLCNAHHFQVPHKLVVGGESRFESVRSGLEEIRLTDGQAPGVLIAVHDAVRPLINPDLIDLSYAEAARSGNAALAVPSSNSVRIEQLDGAGTFSYPREKVYLMQTPQTFRAADLFHAYEQPEDNTCTDDASVVEKTGIPITLVPGDTCNIKITFPDDLLVAERLLTSRRSGSSPDYAQ
ncbi:2-C-methyl-D-erythritol 4-phosphate cytidylyltransferase [Parapedobacter lycopersici]|uniref:2-C-methyl-D-erythritol 4-phosphate cytidylyltransferase n=1 Tax=Parapedobacter lycopersici TaxID=1864939 RepID=UPI00214D5B27|nr:2-C-methyl-D-erythritol 4-phosphate cytidylyltransferase [Parapedobacter lycopersici]